MSPVIEVTNLRKAYGPTVAVADVSFAVERGEIFGILGPNGAGKSTTVEVLAGLRPADGGSTVVLGVDTQREPAAVRPHLGVQLQESRLPARLTVGEALDLYAAFYPEPADAAELLDLLGLTDQRRTAFADLSGGQQQRLSIALALVGNPQVAILDELTTGLDPQARRDTWALIEKVRDAGVTIVLVTHFMDEAERLCDRLVIIDDGRVVAAGSPASLVAAGEDRRTFRMRLPAGTAPALADGLVRLPEVDTVAAVDGGYEVTGGPRVLPAVVLALAEGDVAPDEVRTLSRTLEDVFVDVTGARPPALEAAS
ncbi:ABC transporter ATP-binding protein [Georgenia thermotolerans]|uniref:ABC transporter ATP-binding protein n=1 Tax=Georgenia thermotolerans TaxID=527326 RepID=UPI0012650971|nr:ABC transporter ATP-binding protein [Georgenia thermotolerans]